MEEWKIIIYVPVYNAESTIRELVLGIKETFSIITNASIKSLILVDDGSTDNTTEVIQKLSNEHSFIELVIKEKNQGPASAIFDGMHRAIRKIGIPDQTIVVRMDSDLEHQPQDIPKLISPIIEEKAKISVGYIPLDSRSGELSVSMLKEIGLSESREFLGIDIPQFCPGFNATRGDLLIKILPKLDNLRERFKQKFGKDLLTIDFIILALASTIEEKVVPIKLLPVEEKNIKNIPDEKVKSYNEYHDMTVRFLRAHLSSSSS